MQQQVLGEYRDFGALLGRRFLARLVAAPRGRAFLFNFMADAEENDEGGFDDLLTRVGPDVQKMVRRHRDDERRHARLLRECLARTDAPCEPLPAELRYIDRLDRATNYAFRKGFPDHDERVGIMKVYAMLQVVEERGVVQFQIIADTLRPIDAESATVIDTIVADERRHVQYARAITRRYAPDPVTLSDTTREFRELEARAFVAHRLAHLRFALEHELFSAGKLESQLWKRVALPFARAFSAV